MNTSLKLAGAATVACAACCAVSIVPAFFAGTTLVAIGSASYLWGIGFLLLALPVAGLYLLSRRKPAPKVLDSGRRLVANGCGCGAPDTSLPSSKPPACSLTDLQFGKRAERIRELSRRYLEDAVRTPLTLVYPTAALTDLRDLVSNEQACRTSLTFDLKARPQGVVLIMSAPKDAAATANLLFDQFAPDHATSKCKEIA